jgi:peptidoglycan/LPS O-acetylase OafA/YrhL
MHAVPANLATLTSLRFFAALWVVLYHFLDQLPEGIAGFLVPLHYGPRAVDFFFILSGFILAHVYQPSIEAGRFSLRSFYVKRFARLYPVHLAMLALVIGLFFAARLAGMEIHSAGKYDFSRLWMHLLAVHAWFRHGTNSFNIPSWSISAEFFAYLLFPLMAAAMLRIRFFGLIVVAALLFGLAQIVALAVEDRPFYALQSNFGVVRIVPEFALGMVLWRGWRDQIFVVSPRLLPWLVLAVLPLAAFAWAVILLFAILILSAAEAGHGDSAKFLHWAPLVFLGEASYSLYMVHAPVQTVYFAISAKLGITGAADPLLAVAAYLGGVAVAVAASIILFKLVEAPARDAIARIALHRKRPLPIEPAL